MTVGTQRQGHKVEATHLVLGCIDHRCTDDLQSVVARIVSRQHETGVVDPDAWDRWDHIALPGASLGVVQQTIPSWREAFKSQLAIALQLHSKIATIVVVDHLHCGAYRTLLPGYDGDQASHHARETEAFRQLVLGWHPQVTVERWLLEPSAIQAAPGDFLNWQARQLDAPGTVYPCDTH